MKKFAALLAKEKRLRMNEKMMILPFFELYTVYIKNRAVFTDTYSLTCLKRDHQFC